MDYEHAQKKASSDASKLEKAKLCQRKIQRNFVNLTFLQNNNFNPAQWQWHPLTAAAGHVPMQFLPQFAGPCDEIRNIGQIFGAYYAQRAMANVRPTGAFQAGPEFGRFATIQQLTNKIDGSVQKNFDSAKTRASATATVREVGPKATAKRAATSEPSEFACAGKRAKTCE
ncbi:unnamed protein product [Heligmosomoides polygyrus]|uniref:Coat protein n=1 Tax=Heligmosomoides polygyrus TaxID=6339 RepID=A0A183GNX4_HELPZ|nr:unnamed protein product [Heligmosomoides polygyrus]